MSASADRNLLFGILALQMDFISREQLVAATSKWLTDKSIPIEDILVEQNALKESDRELILPLVERHIENHAGDAAISLASVSSVGSVKEELKALGDKQVEATLALVGTKHTGDESRFATMSTQAFSFSEKKRFQILRPHAKGGLGEVFVAEDMELRREVALKEIQSDFADDPNSRSRFVLEAEVTGGLEHPGIVPVYGLGQYENGRPFYAMRFIKGDSLKEAADRFHQLDPKPSFDSVEFRQLLGRLIDVCNAIAYAHSRGVLHRDLKPGNIMLGKYGETLVVDWGLAKVKGREDQTRDDETTLRPSSGSGTGSEPTRMGSAVGTPSFMPPEQASGRLDELGPASDVYSLGATLYYLLVGRSPVVGKDVGQVLKRVERGEYPTPRSVDPTVPKSLEAVCLKAMAVRSDDRYGSAASLADDVERYLADEPVSCVFEPIPVRARRWIRKHQALTGTMAAAVFVSVLALVTLSTIVGVKNTELSSANERLSETNEKLVSAKEKLSESLNETLSRQREVLKHKYALDSQFGFAVWDSGGEQPIRQVLNSLAKPLDDGTDLRGLEYRLLSNVANDYEFMLHAPNITSIAVTGRRLYLSDEDGHVQILDLETRKQIKQFRAGFAAIQTLLPHPDDGRLATIDQSGLARVWDVDETKIIKTAPYLFLRPNDSHIDWSNHRWWFLGPRDLVFVSLSDDAFRRIELPNGTRSNQMCLDPSGNLYVGTAAGDLLKFSNEDEFNKPVTFIRAASDQKASPITGLAVDGTTENTVVGSLHADGSLRQWNTVDGKETTSAVVHDGGRDVYFMSTISRWLTVGRRHDLLLHVPNLEHADRLRGHDGNISQVATDDDGRVVATLTTRKLVRVRRFDQSRSLKYVQNDLPFPIHRVQLGPDGKHMVTLSSYTFMAPQMWSLPESVRQFSLGRQEIHLKDPSQKNSSINSVSTSSGHTGVMLSVAPSRDGSRYVTTSSDRTARVWDTRSGQELAKLLHPPERQGGVWYVHQALFHPKSMETIYTLNWDGVVREWSVQDEEAVAVGKHQGARRIAISPDGTHVASIGPEALKLWNVSARQLVATIDGQSNDHLMDAAFDESGTQLVVWGDARIHLYRVSKVSEKDWSVELRHSLVGHAGMVNRCRFTREGRRILSSGIDSTIRIWDTDIGKQVGQLTGYKAFDLSRSNTMLVAVPNADNPTLHVFDLSATLDSPPTVRLESQASPITQEFKVICAFDQAAGIRLGDADTAKDETNLVVVVAVKNRNLFPSEDGYRKFVERYERDKLSLMALSREAVTVYRSDMFKIRTTEGEERQADGTDLRLMDGYRREPRLIQSSTPQDPDQFTTFAVVWRVKKTELENYKMFQFLDFAPVEITRGSFIGKAW